MSNQKNSYVALLRGINVGGNHIITMSDLKSVFEDMGFTDVSTYIQSGNVLFNYTDSVSETISEKIEKKLFKKYTYAIPVVTLSYKYLHEIVHNSPKQFGSDPALYRYDVIFLKPPLVASEVIKHIRTKAGVDEAYEGKGVLYFSRLIEKAAQSHLPKIITLPMYKHMTIRNWNTTKKLLELIEKNLS